VETLYDINQRIPRRKVLEGNRAALGSKAQRLDKETPDLKRSHIQVNPWGEVSKSLSFGNELSIGAKLA
jgi:hypothetical protein